MELLEGGGASPEEEASGAEEESELLAVLSGGASELELEFVGRGPSVLEEAGALLEGGGAVEEGGGSSESVNLEIEDGVEEKTHCYYRHRLLVVFDRDHFLVPAP